MVNVEPFFPFRTYVSALSDADVHRHLPFYGVWLNHDTMKNIKKKSNKKRLFAAHEIHNL